MGALEHVKRTTGAILLIDHNKCMQPALFSPLPQAQAPLKHFLPPEHWMPHAPQLQWVGGWGGRRAETGCRRAVEGVQTSVPCLPPTQGHLHIALHPLPCEWRAEAKQVCLSPATPSPIPPTQTYLASSYLVLMQTLPQRVVPVQKGEHKASLICCVLMASMLPHVHALLRNVPTSLPCPATPKGNCHIGTPGRPELHQLHVVLNC